MQSHDLRSLEAVRVHVRLLQRWIGHLEPRQVHDATLAPFISSRLIEGASATTINRTLEVVRTILHRAARSYRDEEGHPWLDALPPMITMLAEQPRSAYPITWEEQDRLFPKLPAHLAKMVLFAGKHGTSRQQRVPAAVELGGLGARSWAQRVHHPAGGVQDQASSRCDPERRGVVDHPGAARPASLLGVPVPRSSHRHHEQHRLAASSTRSRAAQVRTHDLRHTFACRLRAAGYLPRIGQHYWDMATTLWRATMRAPTLADC